MDVEIISERENPLLERREVKFRVKYPGAGSPGRQEVRSRLVAVLDSNKDLTVLDYLKPEYGRHASLGYVKVYASAEAMKAEAGHKVKRNFEVKERPPKAEAGESKPEMKEEAKKGGE